MSKNNGRPVAPDVVVSLTANEWWDIVSQLTAVTNTVIAVDLRVMAAEEQAGGDKVPGCRVLARRWNVSESKATRILRAFRAGAK